MAERTANCLAKAHDQGKYWPSRVERCTDELTEMAAQAPAFGPLINLKDQRCLQPGDMAKTVVRGQANPYCW